MARVEKKTEDASKDKKSLEEKMALLDETISKMENKDITLEQSFNLFNEGMELLKQCNVDVDDIEKKVLVLKKDGELHEL